jgi:hypothetical protein
MSLLATLFEALMSAIMASKEQFLGLYLDLRLFNLILQVRNLLLQSSILTL